MKRYAVVAVFGDGTKRMRIVVQATNQAEAVSCAAEDILCKDIWDASVINVTEMLDVTDNSPFADAT